MRSLNLDQLRALLAVVEEKSFSAAARRLHLTQPAISLQIRELERRFDVQLIERMGKQAHPTAPGRQLVEAAQRIFEACDGAEALMRRYRDGWIGRVRLGVTNTVLMYLLPPILGRLGKEFPGLDLHIRNLPTIESVEAILANTVDLAVVTLPIEARNLKITPLRTERMMAILPVGMKNVPDAVTPEWFEEHPILMEHTRAAVYALFARWLAEHNVSPRVGMHLGSIEALKTFVTANLGVTIIPEMALGDGMGGLMVRPLDPPLERTLALIEHQSKPDETALAIVRNALLTLRR